MHIHVCISISNDDDDDKHMGECWIFLKQKKIRKKHKEGRIQNTLNERFKECKQLKHVPQSQMWLAICNSIPMQK